MSNTARNPSRNSNTSNDTCDTPLSGGSRRSRRWLKLNKTVKRLNKYRHSQSHSFTRRQILSKHSNWLGITQTNISTHQVAIFQILFICILRHHPSEARDRINNYIQGYNSKVNVFNFRTFTIAWYIAVLSIVNKDIKPILRHQTWGLKRTDYIVLLWLYV